MAFEIRDNPTFSWSSSRSRMFEDCELCYGLYYYGAHNGWLKSEDALAQAAYRYKTTRNTEQRLMQTVVDKIYDHYYKGALAQKDLHDQVRIVMNQAFTASKNSKDKWYAQPKHVPFLTEMVTETALPKNLVDKVVSTMDAVVENFYKTQTEAEVATMHELIHLSRFNKFTLKKLDDLTVFVGVHLLYKRDDGKTVAVNFKTSNEKSHVDQLGSLALYIRQKYGVPLEDIVIRDEFLATGTHQDYQLTEEDIEVMYEVIEDSVGMMAEYLVDEDLKRNQAIPLKEFARNPEHSDECSISSCPFCQLVKEDLERFPNGYKSYVV